MRAEPKAEQELAVCYHRAVQTPWLPKQTLGTAECAHSVAIDGSLEQVQRPLLRREAGRLVRLRGCRLRLVSSCGRQQQQPGRCEPGAPRTRVHAAPGRGGVCLAPHADRPAFARCHTMRLLPLKGLPPRIPAAGSPTWCCAAAGRPLSTPEPACMHRHVVDAGAATVLRRSRVCLPKLQRVCRVTGDGIRVNACECAQPLVPRTVKGSRPARKDFARCKTSHWHITLPW